MISFTNTIHIDRSAAEVFAYLSDLEHTPEWNWAITKTSKITPGPIAVGTRYQQNRSVPRHATEFLEIAGLDPNRLIEIEGTLAELAARLSYRLEATDKGTEVINRVELEPAGALRLIAPVLGSRIKGSVADNLSELKARLEAVADWRSA